MLVVWDENVLGHLPATLFDEALDPVFRGPIYEYV